MIASGNVLHAEKKEAVEKKVANYFALKDEFDMRMIDVHQKLDIVRELIKSNIHHIDNPAGVLTGDL